VTVVRHIVSRDQGLTWLNQSRTRSSYSVARPAYTIPIKVSGYLEISGQCLYMRVGNTTVMTSGVGFSGVRFWFGPVDGQAIVNLLQADSLVPTAVRDCYPLISCDADSFFRTHFRANWHSLASVCTSGSLWILCANVSSAFGKRSSSISYVFWTANLKFSNTN
jgi:hypothetical protein